MPANKPFHRPARGLHNSYPIGCGTLIVRNPTVNGIRAAWRATKEQLERRLNEFSALRKSGTDENLFAELAFCLMTPQSKALNCWAAVKRLYAKGLLFNGAASRISRELAGVRFHNTKAARIVLARHQFTANGKLAIRRKIDEFPDIYAARDWFVENVMGLGYKEASHFLRNIGYFNDICILDRHILRNLKTYGVLDDIPSSLPRHKYLAIEQMMKDFARRINIPVSQLDLLLWCRETGEIFK